MRTFLIFGLPRSMTAWMSCFLTCGEVFCQHELTGKLNSPKAVVDDILSQPFRASGIADPGALMVWRELTELLPDAVTIYVRRNAGDSVRSLAKVVGIEAQHPNLAERYDELHQRASDFLHYAEPKVLEFHDLTEEHWLRVLWGWCAGDAVLPEAHLRKMMTLRVTQKDEIIQSAANRPQTKGVHVW